MRDPEIFEVLCVDDQRSFVELAAEMLEREDDRFDVATATNAEEGLDRLSEADFDCIVSDYDMPGLNGIEFLERIREQYPELPFILYTGKGSEEVASDALSAGATDYLQKESGTGQYELLGNRIRNAVNQFHTRQRAVELERIRSLVNDINQALVRADSRPAAETKVCEIFSDSDPYLFAWIGDVESGSDRVTPRASAGVQEGYLQEITLTADKTPTGEGPTGTALRENRIAVSQNVSEDPKIAWTEAALDRGYRAMAAVPLSYGEDLYGGLNVYADRPNAFDEKEKAVLEELGADIGHALHSFEIQQHLETTRDRFHALTENNDVGVVTIDAENTIKYANTAFHDILGYEENGLIGESLLTLLPERHHDEHQAAVDAHLETGTKHLDWSGTELPGCHREGYEVPLELSFGKVTTDSETRFTAVVRDITERKERDQQIEALFSNARIPITYFRYENGDPIVEHVNSAFERKFGINGDSASGQNLDSILVPEERKTEAQSINQKVQDVGQVEMEVQREAGDGLRDFILHTVPVQTTDRFERGYALYYDVTERKAKTAELARQNERLDQFASVVSHDLRNPLNVAEGQLELAEKECDSTHLRVVAEAHDRMETLIEDLLTLAQTGVQTSGLETVDLSEMVTDCWKTVETKDAVLHTETELSIPADPNRLRQLLENLFRNAVEHGGPSVTIRVGDLEDMTGFYISDDGPGIAEADQQNVFEAGYSTAQEGTGLGLNIVQTVAEGHGWDIEISESKTGGARFDISV